MPVVRFIALLCLLPAVAASADEALRTDYEKSDFKATPRYEATVSYARRLADASPWLHYTSFGKSPQGRELPLLVADKKRRFDPGDDRGDDVVLMIQAGIHAGEICGKDAGFLLLRDIAVDKTLAALLNHVTIVFIPIFNVDGHERFGPYNRINQNGPEEMGWRATAQTLNLNRDYLKADTPEMKDWLRLWHEWNPDFFVDCHATDGADYQYTLTYIVELYENIDPALSGWNRDVYLAGVEPIMKSAGFEMFPYVYMLDWPNPKGGIRSWVSTPRFSTGYTALCNRPGLLIETHMLKSYKRRVDATYTMLRETAALLNRKRGSLKEAIEAADMRASSGALRDEPFPLRFEPSKDGRKIEFKGVAYDTETSDLTGGPWYKFGDKPETFEIDYLDKQIVSASARLPAAWVIPPEWIAVIERLALHGIQLKRLTADVSIEVNSYRFSGPEWAQAPFEGRHPVTFETTDFTQEVTYPAGSIVVVTDQRLARVAAHILEPYGPDSYVSWGFFDGIFEQKEGGSTWVLEKMARKMIERDPSLLKAFNTKKAEDPDFAADQRAMLNWFYARSRYWDANKDVYPVGRVFDAGAFDKILQSTEEV